MPESRVYKYPVPFTSEPSGIAVEMPEGSEILHIGTQPVEGGPREAIFIWANVVPENRTVTRKFEIVGTGFSAPTGVHLGTVQMKNGLVLHLFEVF